MYSLKQLINLVNDYVGISAKNIITYYKILHCTVKDNNSKTQKLIRNVKCIDKNTGLVGVLDA